MSSVLGTIPGWLTLFSVILLSFTLWRGGSSTAISGLQDTNKELVRQIHDRDTQIKDLQERVNVLEARTDLTIALVPVIKMLTDHETRAQQRHEGTVYVLRRIADNMDKTDGEI